MLWLGQREQPGREAPQIRDPAYGQTSRLEDVRADDDFMSLHEAPKEPTDAGQSSRQGRQALPVQSREDTDIAWGEQPEPDENDRLYRDRPPHWDSE
jgi:hypothetical protein